MDELAKEGLSNLHVFRNDFTYGNSQIRWMPHYDQLPIEQNTRKFLKEITNSYNCKAWTDLKINNNKFDPNSKLYEWTITYNVINQVKHFKCNSTIKNSFWAFTIKMLHGLLPLEPILKQRRSSWYKNFYCTFCSTNEEETIGHLQQCSGISDLWINLRKDLESYITTLWDTFSNDIDLTSQQQCLYLLIGNTPSSPQFNGLIRAALELKFETLTFDNIKKTLNLPTIKVRNICTKILIKLIQLFRKNIWNERCARVINWERSNNISQRMKTATRKRNLRPLKAQPLVD